MNRIDLIRMGLKNLWRRKLRTFLTILGVLIGTSSIIVMLSIGFGMQESYMGMLSRMGDLTTINVYKGYGGGYMDASSGRKSNEVKLNDEAIENFKNIPHVVAATPLVETWGMILSGKNMAHVTLKGIDPHSMQYFEYKIAEGRLLEPGDNLAVVFGGGMRYNFYNERNMKRGIYEPPEVDLMNDRMVFTFDTSAGYPPMPGEQRPKYKDYNLKVVGVLQEGNWDTDYSVFMPIDTVQKMIKEKEKAENYPQQNKSKDNEYETALVKVDSIDHVEEVQQLIIDSGYNAYSLSDSLKEMKKMSSTIQAVLGGIGAISLLVAAIGITNTMVMSIYERTKEIGIMKVIGASIRDIKRLFLFESALIGLLGGIFGIGMSFLLSFGLNHFGSGFFMNVGFEPGSKISIIPIWVVFAALAFSTFIGILSGYYPARRAMKLSAIEAIRTE